MSSRRWWWGDRGRDEELDEELRSHFAMAVRDRVASGQSVEDATYAARREFGNLGLVKETTREVWGATALDQVSQDVRYGARALRRNPGFTIIAALTLGLSIGANTAIFSLVNALLLRDLPVDNPGELVAATLMQPSGRRFTFSYPLYRAMRDGSRTMSGLFAAGGVGQRRLLISHGGVSETDLIRAQQVTGDFFTVLGAPAALGRTLLAEDDDPVNPRAVAVVSHRFWQTRFGSDTSVIGRQVRLDEVPFTVIGVMPEGFFGFTVGAHPDLWWPISMIPTVDGPRAWQEADNDGSGWIRVMGRVSPSSDRTRAQAELAIIVQRHLERWVGSRDPARWSASQRRDALDRKLELIPGRTGWTTMRHSLRQPLIVLTSGVVLVLIIACANVASLVLARGAARARELSLRGALGAGRGRLVRQLLTESVLLALLGGGIGLALAYRGTSLLATLMRVTADPIAFDLSPDGRVLAFTMAVSLLTGILFGVAPALRGSRLDLTSALKGRSWGVAGGSRQRLNQGLVVGQVALSLVLLMGVGLVVRTLEKLNRVDAGFSRDGIVLFDLDLTRNRTVAEQAVLYKSLVTRLQSYPGAQAASVSTFFLLDGGSWTNDATVPGRVVTPNDDLTVHGMTVGSGFFDTFAIPLLAGRDFDRRDEATGATEGGWTTAVVNQAMARRYFGDENPLGKHFSFGRTVSAGQLIEIVGVVADAKYESLRAPAPPTFYVPYFQRPREVGLTIAARTSTDPRPLIAALPALVREIDPSARPRNIRTMGDVVNGSLFKERVVAQLGGFFGAFALALACLGLYGLLSFGVVQRTREIGVRVALGAARRDVLWMVFGRSVRLVLVGTILGAGAAVAATRGLGALLYEVGPGDPLTLVGASLLLLVMAGLASWIPTRRAGRVDPMVALRAE